MVDIHLLFHLHNYVCLIACIVHVVHACIYIGTSLLSGCVISVTGADERCKPVVKELVIKYGGLYSGDLERSFVTHLLVWNTSSELLHAYTNKHTRGGGGVGLI